MADISEYLLNYLPNIRGLSQNTIRSYRYAFRLLFEYLYTEKKLRIDTVDYKNLEKDTISDWLTWLEEKRGCSIKTRNQRLAAIKSFARYSLRKHFDESLAFSADVEQISKKKDGDCTEAVHFTREEISIILRMPNSTSRIGQRDRTILSVLYATGARAQELCDLKVSDVRIGATTVITLCGKGNKARSVVIPDQCAKLLKQYIEKRYSSESSFNDSSYVFSSQIHEHMTISCLEAIVKKYVESAKASRQDLFCSHYTPHSFRHSIAMHMLESGIPLPVIKTFLGHASIATTLIYASANFALVSKYLKDKDPYAEVDDVTLGKDGRLVLPAFLQ
jgi:site-specific recombinase XerD